MTVESDLLQRSDSKCELCSSDQDLMIFEVPPESSGELDSCALLCGVCRRQIEGSDAVEVNHWRCLNDSMWSQVPAVQVLAWRMLTQLSAEGWPQDLLDMLYLDEDTLARAKSGVAADDDAVTHKDSNGASLAAGDTVTLIKDLSVKGAGFTAKRGTAVRGISLVADNAEHIEGRVNGQQIVILTQFVKKSN